MILGTAAYMAPEQATRQGRRQTRRHLGVRRRALRDAHRQAAVCRRDDLATRSAAILAQSTSESAARAAARAPADRACLERDPKQRLRDIGDAWRLLDETACRCRRARQAMRSDRMGIGRRSARLLVAGCGWMAAAARDAPRRRLACRSRCAPGEQVTTVPAISRTGRRLPTRQAGPRDVAAVPEDAERLRAARSAASLPAPSIRSFLPTIGSIAFFAGGKLQRAPVAGGAATVIASAPAPWGGTWTDDDRIVYVPSFTAGLWRVSANGGTPEQLTKPDWRRAGYAHVFPHACPAPRRALRFWGRDVLHRPCCLKGTWLDVALRDP